VGPFIGLGLTKPEKVERRDGKRVDLRIVGDPWVEMRETTRLFFGRRFLLIVLFIGQAVFAEAVFFTYLACEFEMSVGTIWEILTVLGSVVFGSVESAGLVLVWYCCCHFWQPSWGGLILIVEWE